MEFLLSETVIDTMTIRITANMRLRSRCFIRDRLSISSQLSMDNTVIRSNAMELKYEVNKKPVLIIYTGRFLFAATSPSLAMISRKTNTQDWLKSKFCTSRAKP